MRGFRDFTLFSLFLIASGARSDLWGQPQLGEAASGERSLGVGASATAGAAPIASIPALNMGVVGAAPVASAPMAPAALTAPRAAAAGVLPAPLAPAAGAEELGLPAAAAAPDPAAAPRERGAELGENGGAGPAAASASASESGESAVSDGDALFDGEGAATVGPEIVLQDRWTSLTHKIRLAKHAIAYVLTFGLGVRNARDPDIPTKKGEHARAVALKNAILNDCGGCRASTARGKFGLDAFRIDFSNGYWLVISVDPGVVEVQTPALSMKEYRRLEGFIEEHLYRRARGLGLIPPLDTDGHTNIGILSAFPNVENFAEFMRDQVEHPELGMGLLGWDLYSAPPLAVQDAKQLDAFYRIMGEVKSGGIRSHKALAQRINRDVYYKTTRFNKNGASDGRHYQFFSVKRAESDSFPEIDVPIELRYTASRSDFGLVLLTYELMLKRIAFLNGRKTFANLRRDAFADMLKMSPSEKLSRFYIFIAEMGGDFERYRKLVYLPEIAAAKLDSFVQGKPDWAKKGTVEEILRYLPDLETSEWVRGRMGEILADPRTPASVRGRLAAAIRERLARPGIPSDNKDALGRWWRGRPS